MTVKDIFELRRQGKTEEAYEAIRPLYAVHKGKYTTLCMFWVGHDMLKKRLWEQRTPEALKIFEALLRVQPAIDDRDGRVHAAIVGDALRLKQATPAFSMLSFVERYGAHRLAGEAQQVLAPCFQEIEQHPDADHALTAMPLLQEAVRRNPHDERNRRYMATVYTIMGEHDKAASLAPQHEAASDALPLPWMR